MPSYQPAPTYAEVVIDDPRTGKKVFNPVWLRWFLDLVQTLTNGGATPAGIAHNNLVGLQGGGATERYHLTAAQDTALIGGSTTDAAPYHTHRSFPAGTTLVPPTKLTSGTNTTAPIAGAVEYDGNKLYMTLGDATRRRMNVSDEVTAISSITVTASPFAYQNTTNFSSAVLVNGGTVSLVEFSRDGTNWFSVAAVTNTMVYLGVGDHVRVTYTVAPTMRLVPL